MPFVNSEARDQFATWFRSELAMQLQHESWEMALDELATVIKEEGPILSQEEVLEIVAANVTPDLRSMAIQGFKKQYLRSLFDRESGDRSPAYGNN